MVSDALQQFTSSITKIAAFRSAGFPLPGGTPRRGLTARVLYSAASVSAATGACAFSIDLSYDGGSTWTSEFISDTIALSTVATQGEVFIPYRVVKSALQNGGVPVQVALSLYSISGTNATVTYQGDAVTGGPA
jgi:hypothetical protein